MFTLEWTAPATTTYLQLKAAAEASLKARKANKKTKASKQEGLLKQVAKSIQYLALLSNQSTSVNEFPKNQEACEFLGRLLMGNKGY